MGARLSQMRRYVTAAKVHAVSIALMAPRTLAEPAERLAEAAHRLAVTAAKNTDLAIRMSNRPPDFRELDARTADFSEEAVSYARRKQATVRARGPRVSRVRGRRAAAPPSDVPTTAADL